MLCHISHVYPTGASLYFTVVAGQRGNPIEQWRKAKTAASDAMMRTGATITHHHAVGADHRPWMRDEVGDLGVAGAAGGQGDARSGRNPQPRQADSVTIAAPRHGADQPRVGARQRAARGRTGGRAVAPSAASTSSPIAGTDAEHARRLVDGALERGMDALVVVGGDGIISLALQVLAQTDIPLGIIPAGTGNDHAREFGIPAKDPEAAADVIVDGVVETVDLGRIKGADGTDKWFGTVMAAGFDSLVTDRTNRMRWPHGRMRYNVAMVAELSKLRLLPFRLTFDGRELDHGRSRSPRSATPRATAAAC